MKILILTARIPYPLRDGGSIAMNQTIEGYLEQGCDVSLLAMNTSRHWVEETSLPEMYSQLKHFKTVYVKTDINPLLAFINLFSDKSYNLSRFVNKQFEQALVELLQQEEFDIIQFESIYVSSYLAVARKYSEAKCYCRVHNIEHFIWQGLADHEKSFLKRKYLLLLTTRLKAYELDILTKFDLLLPISKTEEHFLISNKINNCYYLPFGVAESSPLPAVSFEANSCYHIGSMDWAPNMEGILWFLENVWSKMELESSDIKFYLAGKNMPQTLFAKGNARLIILGEIEDIVAFSTEKNIMIVPLLSGAGIRIKIIEAMALGKTIVTTTVGIAGIDAVHGEHILIADTAEEFIQQIHFCFEQPEKAKGIGKNAQQFVRRYFLKQKIYSDLIQHFIALK